MLDREGHPDGDDEERHGHDASHGMPPGPHDPGDEGVELVERAVVHVREVGSLNLLLVGDEPRFPFIQSLAGTLCAHLARSRDGHNGIVPALAADLVEKRHLVHHKLRRIGRAAQLLPPGEVRAITRGCRSASSQSSASRSVTTSARPVDLLPVARSESLAQRRAHLGVVIELVHDLVARDRGGTVPRAKAPALRSSPPRCRP